MKPQKSQAKDKPVQSKTNPGKKNTKKPHIEKDNLLPLKRWLGLIVAATGFILYIQTTGYKFVLDDYSLILENNVTKQGVSAIPQILKTSYRTGYTIVDNDLYRPISKIMFAVEYSLAGENAFLGHWINILIYAFTGFLLFQTLCKYFNNQLIVPFITSLLFMAHPIHTEVVANIKSRDELLGLMFTVTSMWFLHKYLFKEKFMFLLLAALAFFLANMSKESYITFIALVPLLIYFFTDTPSSKNIKTTLVMLAPAILYLLIRRGVLGGSLPATQSVADNLLAAAPDISHRLATAILILGMYLKLLFFPHPLVFDYSFNQIPIVSAGDWKFLLSFVVYVALSCYAILRFKQKDLISFSILVYFIFLAIYTNLVFLIGSSFGERFMYGPSLGFCLAIGLLISRVFKKGEIIPGKEVVELTQFFSGFMKPVALTAVIVIAFGFKTISRNPAWKNNLALYTNDVKLSPNSTRTHYYLGNLLTKDDYYKDMDSTGKSMMLDSAIRELQRSVDIYPKFSDAYNQMGVAYYRKKNFEKAFEKYQLALGANPTDATVHNNMGTILFETGRYQEAINAFTQAVRYNPSYSEGFANLGSAYGMLQQYDNAITYLKQAVKFNPSYAQAYFFLGITYRFKGDEANAQNYINKAYALDPSLKK